MGNNDDLYDANDTLAKVLLSIGATCALITFLTFTAFKNLRQMSTHLIIFLCITIVFSDLFLILTSVESVIDSSFCKGVSAILHFFLMSNYCWTFCVAFNFYQHIVRRNPQARNLYKYYHVFSWGLPAVLTLSAGASSSYGSANGGCFFDSDSARFATFFLPGFLIIFANAVVFIFLVREVHEALEGSTQNETHRRRVECFSYFLFFASSSFAWLLGYILYVLEYDTTEYIVFLFLFTIIAPLQGFLVFFAYCMTERVRYTYRWALGFLPCFSVIPEWGTTGATGTTQSNYKASSSVGTSSV